MKKGFTLVEILVAIIILSIGILAVSQLTIMGIRINTIVNQRMHARVVLAGHFDELHSRPSGDAWVCDQNSSTNLDLVDSTADYFQTITDTMGDYPYVYQLRWNIADNTPETGLKTIRIHVLWGTDNRISTDLIKRM